MDKHVTKNKLERVVKPIKEAIQKRIDKKKTGKDAFTQLSVVNEDGTVIKVFRKSEYGPRFIFKANQYASQHSTLDERLTVE